jgi:hypothetical protein
MSECVIFLKVLDLQIKLQQVGKNLSARATSLGENCGIFSIVSFLPSIFARTADVAPDVGFRHSWCHWKACDTFFLKVMDLREGELGFARCGVFCHVGGSFSDRESGLTGEALDDPRVARCS